MPHRHQEHDYIPAMGKDRWLPFYDVCTWLLGAQRIHRRLIELAGVEPGHEVLEIGCGPGGLVLRAQRMHPDAEIVGLDPDPLALARARRKAERAGLPVRFDQGKAGELPYPDESFDRVLSSFMFHHLDDAEKDRALAEARRVLRPGGQLHLVDVAGHHHGRFSRRMQHSELLRANAGDGIPDRMRTAGFNAVRTGERGRLHSTYFSATR
jgi:ubiquinone/menaquinone biosynthesis C-methylase UbiE